MYIVHTLTSNVHNKHSATIQVDPTKTMCLARRIEQKQTDRRHSWGNRSKVR